ncbi:OMS28 family porin [Borreliella garinii]|uniref:OMS28 family porin n=1 Tax=Borreliella garinii TaxID=29519 RepID=UPI00018ACEEF|nr:OMS28 family porin [Borreliella garinii]ACL35115.1 outer membrane porin [Borreliella garinii Far04]WNZ68240.1 OMS28 family porin [Borreliella garinii]WNZ69239.1 OMS28 family porin [Borreliella garinii]WNZ70241.1 OMS28 family porin [Borreliella garinii]
MTKIFSNLIISGLLFGLVNLNVFADSNNVNALQSQSNVVEQSDQKDNENPDQKDKKNPDQKDKKNPDQKDKKNPDQKDGKSLDQKDQVSKSLDIINKVTEDVSSKLEGVRESSLELVESNDASVVKKFVGSMSLMSDVAKGAVVASQEATIVAKFSGMVAEDANKVVEMSKKAVQETQKAVSVAGEAMFLIEKRIMSNKSPNNKDLELTKEEFAKVEQVKETLMASERALDETAQEAQKVLNIVNGLNPSNKDQVVAKKDVAKAISNVVKVAQGARDLTKVITISLYMR